MATKSEPLKENPQETATTETENIRERSTIGFAYLDLDDAIEIAKGVHTVGGSSCQWDQLAAHLEQSAGSSTFRLRLQTCKMYGMVTYDRGMVSLTPLGTRICDPDQERAARVESFLTIPLYKSLYEQFKRATLPPNSGLETAIVTLGVGQKQKEKARQVFQRSAKSAGFFEVGGSSRLVVPSIKASAPSMTLSTEEKPKEQEEPERKKASRSGGGGDEHHPFIQGLLTKLPPADSNWPMEDRTKWLQAAVKIFDLMYTDDDGRKSITVDVKDSAR